MSLVNAETTRTVSQRLLVSFHANSQLKVLQEKETTKNNFALLHSIVVLKILILFGLEISGLSDVKTKYIKGLWILSLYTNLEK